MEPKRNHKLCWNCEGEVHIHVEQCPYCGTDLAHSPSEKPSVEEKEVQAASFPLDSRQKESKENSAAFMKTTLPPLYSTNLSEEISNANRLLYSEEEVVEKKNEFLNNTPFIALVFLLPGSLFLVFGLILFIFSQDGVLTLVWNARYSLLYVIFGTVLSWIGWKIVQRNLGDSQWEEKSVEKEANS